MLPVPGKTPPLHHADLKTVNVSTARKWDTWRELVERNKALSQRRQTTSETAEEEQMHWRMSMHFLY